MKSLFDGETQTSADQERLSSQLFRVFDVMRDGVWRSPEDLERLTGYRWASISARLRDFRKPKFGGHTVDRKSAGNGEFLYRLAPNGQLRIVSEPVKPPRQMAFRLVA